ncbi:MAG: HmuY family protein [Bacteroidaceae bacterium]|nr:HmuY family protein [Bacteroidaceae bacterium]
MKGRTYIIIYLLGAILSLSACRDVFSNLYDDEDAQPMSTLSQNQLYVDASSWTDWYYIDLKAVRDSIARDAQYVPSGAWVRYAIPVTEAEESGASDKPCGIYTYWYDVFGEGLTNHQYHSFYPTEPQPEPEHWSIAVHRNNVRTNGGEVLETNYGLMRQLPESSEAFKDSTFIADEWSEMDVWAVKDQMLQGLIGSQGIKVNPVLSSWLRVEIPPMPPLFTLNSHVFILRMNDGTCAALQLENYMDNKGTKCCLTINYKYPY